MIQEKCVYSQRVIASPTHDYPDPYIYLLDQFRAFILEATENLTKIIRK